MEQNGTSYSSSDAFKIMRSRIENLLLLQESFRSPISAIFTVANMALNYAISSEFDVSNLQDAITELAKIITETRHENYQQVAESIEIPNSALETLQELVPLVPEEEREEFAKNVAPVPGEEVKIFSKKNFWSIISVILTTISIVLVIITQEMSEKTKQFFCEETDRQISAIEENSELEREEIEALNNIYGLLSEFYNLSIELNASGDGAMDGLNPIGDNVDNIDNLVISDRQDKGADAQQENYDLQK